MNVLVLGASGGCGSWMCRLALQRGHRVTALVRDGSVAPDDRGINQIVADPLDSRIWPELLSGQDAILSGLGIRRRYSANPFSQLESPQTLTYTVLKHVVGAATELGINHIAVVSAAGVGDSYEKASPLIRWFIKHSNIAHAYRDLEKMENTLRNSGMNWLSVRPTTLTNRTTIESAHPVDRYGLFDRIARKSVASWMVDFLETGPPDNRTPMISGLSHPTHNW